MHALTVISVNMQTDLRHLRFFCNSAAPACVCMQPEKQKWVWHGCLSYLCHTVEALQIQQTHWEAVVLHTLQAFCEQRLIIDNYGQLKWTQSSAFRCFSYWLALTNPLSKCDSFLLSEKHRYDSDCKFVLKQKTCSLNVVLTAYLLSSWLMYSMLHWRINTWLERQEKFNINSF